MIFFDIDGTLINHKEAEKIAAKQLAIALSLPNSHGEGFADRWHETSEYFMNQYLQGKISFARQRHLRLEEMLEQELSAVQAKKLFEVYLEAYKANWILYDDVIDCLDRINSPIGIITNGNTKQQLKKLSQTSIIDRFSVVVTSEEVGKSKPDPAIFHSTKARIKNIVSICTYIGDSLENDALAASAAGWKGIWLNRDGKQVNKRRNIQMIDTLADLNI